MNKTDEYLKNLPSWQSDFLSTFRQLVHEVEPRVIEEFKWNVPVFLVNGKVQFAMSAFKAHVKFNFMANGAVLEDTDHLFNNGFDSKKSRGVDLKEGDIIDAAALKVLIAQSIDINL